MITNQLVLASASPRRKELLAQIGICFTVQVSDVDETLLPGEAVQDYVTRLALAKARVVAAQTARPVLGADTVVVIDGEIFCKPRDREHGIAMLQRLQGRSHEVMTGVALCWQGRELVAINQSKVFFKALSREEVENYWESGEPCDKAGGYAVQGLGSVFIERIEGSYSGVMGLPLFETAALLAQIGIDPLRMDKG